MPTCKKSLLYSLITSSFVMLPSISYSDEATSLVEFGIGKAAPTSDNFEKSLNGIGVNPIDANKASALKNTIKSASTGLEQLYNGISVAENTINNILTKTKSFENISGMLKNPKLKGGLQAISRQINGKLDKAKKFMGGTGKFAGKVATVVNVVDWGVNMYAGIYNFIDDEDKGITSYTDILMQATSLSLVGALSNEFIYKPIKGIGEANEQINDSKSEIVSMINKEVMGYIQGNAIAKSINGDLRRQKLDYSNISSSELDNYLATKISQETNKIDEAVVHLEKSAKMLNQTDAVFLFWDVDAGKYLAKSVGDYIYTLKLHKKEILNNKSKRYNQYRDILIASISQQLIKDTNDMLNELNNNIDELAEQQKEIYGDLLASKDTMLQYRKPTKETLKNNLNSDDNQDITIDNTAHNVYPSPQPPQDDTPPSQEEVRWHGFDSSTLSENGSHGMHYSTEADIVASDNPITNGKVTITDSWNNNSYKQSVDFGDYQYVAWGKWSYSRNGGKVFKKLVYGKETAVSNMPKTGSAHYNGTLHGDFTNFTTGALEHSSVTGDISLTADFSTKKIQGSINARHNGRRWANAIIKSTTIDGNQYHASVVITNGDGDGVIKGGFFGPNASETGGAFELYKDFDQSAGVFRAKKQ